ncbi:MAG: hypothetical protein NTZ13_04320 [Candidatus Parcubacteria bacterium]|nr:hypothetical protein [Candidatus Parcubacteria bacterium]
MINNEILNFIKDRHSQGETKEQITDMLVTHGGWDAKDVEEAYEAMEMSNTSMPSAISSAEKEIIQSLKKDEVKPEPASFATPVQSQPEILKPTALNITPAPSTREKPTPVVVESKSPVSGMKSASIFTMMAKSEPGKTLEPTIRPTVHTPELFVPPQTEIQKDTTSPAIPNPVNPNPSVSVPVEDEKTLKELRARFMEGRIVSPPVTATPSPTSPATPTASGGIGFPKTMPGAGLFSHSQQGMIPTEKPPMPIDVVAPTPTPTVQETKPFIAPPPTRPFAGFPPGQKVSVVPAGNIAQQKGSLPQNFAQPKAPGRKLLSFFMFAIGVVCGGVAMHAYLNGYMDPALQWVMTVVKSLGL